MLCFDQYNRMQHSNSVKVVPEIEAKFIFGSIFATGEKICSD